VADQTVASGCRFDSEKCEAPLQLVPEAGVCAPAGDCLGGNWLVVGNPSESWANAVTINVDGEATDTFVIVERSSTYCQTWNINTELELHRVSSDGTQAKVKDLGCNNKEYKLQQTFFCTEGCYAYAGFVADRTVASGCRFDSDRVGQRDDEDGDTAQGHTALVFGIICGCMVLIAVLGCVYVAWKKKCGGTAEQVLQSKESKECNLDDLERADHEVHQDTEVERQRSQTRVPSHWAAGCEPAEPVVRPVILDQIRTLSQGVGIAPNDTERLKTNV